MERLDKYLSSQGFGSRKDVGKLIRSGTVVVNGEAVKQPDRKLDPDRDRVSVGGEEVAYRRFTYIMMNKPAGVLSATEDPHAKTVLDLLPPELFRRGLFPAGRLDKDTTGLLILTDDGGFAHRMLSPKNHVYKLYEARLERPVTREDAEAFARGVSEGGEDFAPALLQAAPGDGRTAFLSIREGKFHQVKRMFLAVGNRVLALNRRKIGCLSLDDTLQEGEARLLTEEEIERIFHVKMHENRVENLDFIQTS